MVALKKGQLQVLSNAWDRDLGGRNLDIVLFEHFVRWVWPRTLVFECAQLCATLLCAQAEGVGRPRYNIFSKRLNQFLK